MDISTDEAYQTSLKRKQDSPDVVHLTHLTTPESIYHLRLGFSSFASKPQESKWYTLLMWPVTCWSMIMNNIYGRTFIVERNEFEKLNLQAWVIPRYKLQYHTKWQKEAINGLIEEAILEAEATGAKVLSLGLLNQDEELNNHGQLYIQKHPRLKIKVVDGSSLAVAVVLNSIPKGTSEVVLRGELSKVAISVVSALCQRGIKVATLYPDEYEKLKVTIKDNSNLVLSRSFSQKVWLVGDGLKADEQRKASTGTIFIPFSHFPPKQLRDDCLYHCSPAMLTPKSLKNMHSCENWLPRRVMSAWRVAGIVHALEEWDIHECGDTIFSIEKVWQATLSHGFRPLQISS